MRIHHILLGLVVPATVAAQPVMQPSQCDVTISRAPDEVREAIEAWVKAEPRCATTLDVRVVPTDGGFYLFARDTAGRVRERIVPDAQSAGVLVASWVADDLVAGTPAPEAPPGTAPVVVGTPAPEAPSVVAVAAPRAPTRWLSAGGMLQPHGESAVGGRVELDLVHRGKWSLIGAVALSRAAMATYHNGVIGRFDFADSRAILMLSRTLTLGSRWDLRIGFGLGVIRSSLDGLYDGVPFEQTVIGPTAEGSLLLSRSIGENWGLVFAPIATWFPRTVTINDSFEMYTFGRRGAIEVMLFGGLRRRL